MQVKGLRARGLALGSSVLELGVAVDLLAALKSWQSSHVWRCSTGHRLALSRVGRGEINVNP
jgi:hypothetical protein